MKYAIIDIETTGGTSYNSKITEVAIFVHDGEKVIDTFHSLVNPEMEIPRFITGLTGITNEMVASAPLFSEIAEDIFLKTVDCVFVAHNVNFDYSFIRQEFKQIGIDYKRKKACTVRLSRAILPGCPSYSLGNLCSYLGIDIQGRHRAAGDAEATVKLFEILLAHDQEGNIQKAINVKSKEATIPPNLKKEIYENLPDETGVYYFLNGEGQIIYIGKAIHIKQRIYQHFTSAKGAKLPFLNEVYDIQYTVTGSELAALLLESHEIKKHFPKYNKAQRISSNFYCLYDYVDQMDIHRLVIGKKASNLRPIMLFNSFDTVRSYLFQLMDQFDLCAKCCGIDTSSGACYRVAEDKCYGVCCEKEGVEDYNERVEAAIQFIKSETGDKLIIDRGRHREEKCIVVIKEGSYRGFGYIPADAQLMHVDEALDYITQYQDNNDVQRILRGWK
jgi:DNA polymerase III subunit epsilon